MSAQTEQAATEFLELFDVDQLDLAAINARLAPDARYLNHAKKGEPFTGRGAIEAELRDQFTRYKDCVCRIDAIASNARGQVFVERLDTVTMRADGRKVDIMVCAVFDFDAQGLITYWREYWDMGDVLRQIEEPKSAELVDG